MKYISEQSTRYKGHFIIIKESICQENINILKMSAPDNRASKHLNQKTDKISRRKRHKRTKNKYVIKVKDFNTPSQLMIHTKIQKRY